MIPNPKIPNQKSQIKNLSLIILMIVWVLVWVLRCGDVVTAGPYLDSAHGDSGYGVLRTSLSTAPNDYARGNCAHCHEMHAPAPYNFALFYDYFINKCELFCYKCHAASTVAEQAVTNYTYSYNFGGWTDTFYSNIKIQFCSRYSRPVNCGSSHNLGKIRELINAYGWGFPSDPNPCVACHPPHYAQRNYDVEFVGDKLKTAIRRPSHYKSTDPKDFLWGDDSTERMNKYNYQAPFYGSPGDTTSGRYEPDGSTSEPAGGWGSNMPDYVTFCLDCHQNAVGGVKDINWGSNGDRHGAHRANDCKSWCAGEGTLKPPYDDLPNFNYVLSCTDCHEPHGTYRRLHLIRRFVNGQEVSGDEATCDERVDWEQICGKCHNIPQHDIGGGCIGCHSHGATDDCGTASPGRCRGKPLF